MAEARTKAERPPARTRVSPVASVTRRDGVVHEVRRAVVTGALRPGEKLTEVQLAEWLSVSRPTLREALNQLCQEGLLVQEPYRGLRVATIDPTSIMDLANLRMALDMLAATAICEDESGRRLGQVEKAWQEFSRTASDPDPALQHEAHVAFHRRIWMASENVMLLRTWPMIEAHLTLALAHDQATRDDPERAHRVHERLVEALRTRDLEAIREAFERHTMDSARELIAILEQKETA